MTLDKRGIENILRNFFYTDILNKIEHSCKQTANSVIGAEVMLVKGFDTYYFDIEEWLINLDFDYESATIENIQDICRNLSQKATEYEKEKLGNRNADNCTCYMLSEWHFLQNEVGGIINNGKVTLVKYAKILEDME